MFITFFILMFIFFITWKKMKYNSEFGNQIVMKPISKRSLLWCAAQKHVFSFAKTILVLIFVFGTIHLMGRIDMITALTCVLVVIAIFGALYIPIIEALVSMLKTINSIDSFHYLLKGKYLYNYNGGWTYVDKDWFIDVGERSACILYAPVISLTKPLRFETISWWLVHGCAYINNITFYDRKNNRFRMRIHYDDRLQEWLSSYILMPL